MWRKKEKEQASKIGIKRRPACILPPQHLYPTANIPTITNPPNNPQHPIPNRKKRRTNHISKSEEKKKKKCVLAVVRVTHGWEGAFNVVATTHACYIVSCRVVSIAWYWFISNYIEIYLSSCTCTPVYQSHLHTTLDNLEPWKPIHPSTRSSPKPKTETETEYPPLGIFFSSHALFGMGVLDLDGLLMLFF